LSIRVLDSLDDLIDIWEQAESYDKEEVFSILSKLINTINAEPNFVSDAKYHLAEKCVNDNICPKCFNELSIETHLESRGECRGCSVDETVGELNCNYCGWKLD
jgi:hypothetical protein